MILEQMTEHYKSLRSKMEWNYIQRLKTYLYDELMSNLPVSQLDPVHPLWQLHEYDPIEFTHMP